MKRFSLTGFYAQFTLSRIMTVFVCLLVLILMRLGFWQIQRAHEKNNLLNNYQRFSQQAPVLWTARDPMPMSQQPIQLAGHFLNTTLLLDNQYYQHMWGYDVLSPFVLNDGKVVLVDRGWVPGDKLRLRFPLIKNPTGPLTLSGRAYVPSQQRWILGPMLERKNMQLAVIEHVEPRMVEDFLHKSVYPFIMRLDEHEKWSYVREWPVVSMSPVRHYGYAVQWFALALVLVVLSILLLKKKE